MTDAELLELGKVGPAEAARYLQNGTTQQQVRVWAQTGTCPFCQAIKLEAHSKRIAYRVHIGNLIAYKHGAPTTAMPPIPYGMAVKRPTVDI